MTFANGMTVRERILDLDEERRRVAYTVIDAPGLAYHHASMQIDDEGPGRCRFLWVTDFLPAEARDSLMPLIEQGSAALKANLEAGHRTARRRSCGVVRGTASRSSSPTNPGLRRSDRRGHDEPVCDVGRLFRAAPAELSSALAPVPQPRSTACRRRA